MLSFKRIKLETNMDPFVFYRLDGLPDGESASVMPEDSARPRGEWYVATKRNGRKGVIRCKSLDAAKEAAVAWASTRGKKKTRGATR